MKININIYGVRGKYQFGREWSNYFCRYNYFFYVKDKGGVSASNGLRDCIKSALEILKK